MEWRLSEGVCPRCVQRHKIPVNLDRRPPLAPVIPAAFLMECPACHLTNATYAYRTAFWIVRRMHTRRCEGLPFFRPLACRNRNATRDSGSRK